MKLINKIKDLILKGESRAAGTVYVLSACFLAIASTSCSMVNEDLEPCAPDPKEYTVVNFVYDYNMSAVLSGKEEDWFDEHAGSVYLYIFDKDGYYHSRYTKHKEFFAPGEDFTMTFTSDELIPGETYNFVAVAQGNTFGYTGEDDDEYQWFKPVTPMEPGKRIEDYILRLDRKTGTGDFSQIGVINYKDQYGKNQQMIDTLWTTRPDSVQTVTIKKYGNYTPSVEQQPDSVTNVTIPMMRITNSIKVNLVSKAFTEDTSVDDYHVVIYFPHGNGTVDFTGATQPAQPLLYQSLIKEMQPYEAHGYRSRGGGGTATRAEEEAMYKLRALFGVSRLQTADESELRLYRADNLEEPIYVMKDFSKTLAQWLNDPSWNYGDQEFLDREYDFEVEITLPDAGDPIVALTIDVIDWWVRINNIGF